MINSYDRQDQSPTSLYGDVNDVWTPKNIPFFWGPAGEQSGSGGGGGIPGAGSHSTPGPWAEGYGPGATTGASTGALGAAGKMASNPFYDLLGLLGSSLMGGLFSQPTFQQRESYRGTTADPVNILTKGFNNASSLFDLGMGNLKKGISLPNATAQDLPSYGGGGMPMRLGIWSSDPAKDNPSSLFPYTPTPTPRTPPGGGDTIPPREDIPPPGPGRGGRPPGRAGDSEYSDAMEAFKMLYGK